MLFKAHLLFANKNNIDSLKKVIKYTKNDSVKLSILKATAYAYFSKSNFDSSLYYFEKMEDLASKTRQEWALADYYEGAGIINLAKTNYKAASDYYFRALRIREKINNNEKLGNLLRKIGDSYSVMLQTDLAETYYNKALNILGKNGDKSNYVICLNNFANNLRRAKKFTQALKVYESVLPLYEKLEPVKGTANTYEEMGICYAGLKDFKKSKALLEESWKLAQTLQNKGTFSGHILHHLMKTLGELKSNVDIEKYEKISIEENLKIGSKEAIMDIANILQEHYQAKNNFKKALFYADLSKENQFLITEENKKKIVESLGLEYNFEKEKQLTTYQNTEIENQRKRNKTLLIGISLIGILLSSVIVLYIILRKEKIKTQDANSKLFELNNNLDLKVRERTKEIKEINIQLETANEELVDAIVKGQNIERKRLAGALHDNLGGQITALKYSFMAIPSLIDNKAFSTCKSIISTLYEDVRNISHEVYPKDLEYGLEKALTLYFERINNNSEKTFYLEFQNYNNLSQKVEFELYSIIQELITNTLKHSSEKEIFISHFIEKNNHIFTYSDYPNQISKSNGKGLLQIKERCEVINAELNTSHQVRISFTL